MIAAPRRWSERAVAVLVVVGLGLAGSLLFAKHQSPADAAADLTPAELLRRSLPGPDITGCELAVSRAVRQGNQVLDSGSGTGFVATHALNGYLDFTFASGKQEKTRRVGQDLYGSTDRGLTWQRWNVGTAEFGPHLSAPGSDPSLFRDLFAILANPTVAPLVQPMTLTRGEGSTPLPVLGIRIPWADVPTLAPKDDAAMWTWMAAAHSGYLDLRVVNGTEGLVIDTVIPVRDGPPDPTMALAPDAMGVAITATCKWRAAANRDAVVAPAESQAGER